MEQHMDGILGKDVELLEEVALRSVKLKGLVVGQDPDENNRRVGLNLGHTIGHAIEFVSNFKLSHGEAVGLGIRAVLHISRSLGGITAKPCDAAEALLSRLGVPTKVPLHIDRELVEKKLASSDKKAVDGVPYFVRIDGIGILHAEKGQYASPIPKKALDEALDYIFR
jgi:3-dehydroquinate synthase